MESKKIIIVEDDVMISNMLTAILSGEQYKVVEHLESAEEALEIGTWSEIDVLITDYMLPKMTGKELAVRIRGRFPRVKIILITAADALELRLEERGAIDVILYKPFKVVNLLKEL